MGNRDKGMREGQKRGPNGSRREERGGGKMSISEAGQKGGERVRELVHEGERSEEGKPRR